MIRFLVAPQVVSLPDIATLSDFADFDTVILADVPRLPAAVATSLAKYVADGGGLLVAAGQKTQPDFFNGWTTEDKAPLLPATLGEVTFASGDQPFSPSAQTLTHPALQKIADASKSDFAGTVITNFRPQNIPDALSKESSVGARLNNGDILLTSRKVGRGQVILLGIPLDLSSGNLVTRQAFLPLIHELVYHLADPAAYQLNLEPGWEVNIGLTGKRGRAIGEGLIGRYYASQNATEAAFTRQDEAINFNWLNGIPAPGIPADNFRVEWTGKIQLPDPKKLNFKVEVDDAFDFWIDGKPVGQFRVRAANAVLRASLRKIAGMTSAPSSAKNQAKPKRSSDGRATAYPHKSFRPPASAAFPTPQTRLAVKPASPALKFAARTIKPAQRPTQFDGRWFRLETARRHLFGPVSPPSAG